MILSGIKIVAMLGVVLVGSVLLVDRVPFLKANIIEVVNPRVQEGRLVQQLHDTLTQLDEAVTDTTRDELIAESKAVVERIAELNEEHSGVVSGVIRKITEVLIGTDSPSSSPTPTATSSASPANSSSTSTSPQAGSEQTPTPSLCVCPE